MKLLKMIFWLNKAKILLKVADDYARWQFVALYMIKINFTIENSLTKWKGTPQYDLLVAGCSLD